MKERFIIISKIIRLFIAAVIMGIMSGCSEDPGMNGETLVEGDGTGQKCLKSTKTATTVSQLRSYLQSANPGDVIQIYGTLNVSDGCIITSRAGSSNGHIVIKGINSGTLKFTGYAKRACMNIRHDYYKIYDLKIDANGNSDRGLLIEDADHGKVVNVEVRNTNNEGYKIRKNSQYWYFDQCSVFSTGLAGKYGEGFYCGDANANWSTGSVADKTGYITFNNCYAKPFADGFDCKEGTHHIKIVNSTVNFDGKDVDPQYGNHGISTRCDYFQVINCTIKNNTKGVGECVWAGKLKAKDGKYYGKKCEIKKLTGYNMKKYLYWTSQTDTKLYTDYSISMCAGVKDTSSPNTAESSNPSNFSQMTWNGEGGGVY